MATRTPGSAVADPQIRLSEPQEARLDQGARGLLADPMLGPLIREACGAIRCGRRDRGRALHTLDAMVRTAFAEPVVAETLARAIAMAWRERLDALTGGTLTNARLREQAFHNPNAKGGTNAT